MTYARSATLYVRHEIAHVLVVVNSVPAYVSNKALV
jgi:hypothetical protein